MTDISNVTTFKYSLHKFIETTGHEAPNFSCALIADLPSSNEGLNILLQLPYAGIKSF